MRPHARTIKTRMTNRGFCRGDGSAIAKDDNRALAVEKADDVVVIGGQLSPCATWHKSELPSASSCLRSTALKYEKTFVIHPKP